MKTSVQEFIDIAEELNARIASHTIGLPWFGDLWPFAVKLADCWKLIADELPDENRTPPFVLAEVWNGCEAKLTSQLPPDCSFERFQELLQPNPGQWGRQQWMTFVLLRDTDGTIWNPLPAMYSSESKGFAAIVPTAEMSLIPSEFTRAQAVSILEKWIRHVLRMEGRLEAEPAGRTPDPAENELGPLGQSKNNLPQTADVSEFYRLQKLKSWESKPKAEIHRAIARKNLKKSKTECTEGNLKTEVERVRKAIRDYEKKQSPQH